MNLKRVQKQEGQGPRAHGLCAQLLGARRVDHHCERRAHCCQLRPRPRRSPRPSQGWRTVLGRGTWHAYEQQQPRERGLHRTAPRAHALGWLASARRVLPKSLGPKRSARCAKATVREDAQTSSHGQTSSHAQTSSRPRRARGRVQAGALPAGAVARAGGAGVPAQLGPLACGHTVGPGTVRLKQPLCLMTSPPRHQVWTCRDCSVVPRHCAVEQAQPASPAPDRQRQEESSRSCARLLVLWQCSPIAVHQFPQASRAPHQQRPSRRHPDSQKVHFVP
mmetsp:Transcript_2140/g.4896  ORF Transcript_2140/g.4896 Transcript_2140/m.4896 type:complete len:278 (-) Transcript_2140:722-1555(-)